MGCIVEMGKILMLITCERSRDLINRDGCMITDNTIDNVKLNLIRITFYNNYNNKRLTRGVWF